MKTNQNQNIIPSIPLPGRMQLIKAESLRCLSAVLLYHTASLSWTYSLCGSVTLEGHDLDMTPRLCSYLVDHSLQLGSTIFWEESRLNQYCWPDPVPKSPLVKREESRQGGRSVMSHTMVFLGKKQTEAQWAGVLDPSLRCKLMAERGGYVTNCQC